MASTKLFNPRSQVRSAARKGTNQTFSFAKMKEAYPPNWPELSAECKRLANYTCAQCGFRSPPPFQGMLHAHHLRSATKSGNVHSQKNLQCLCEGCHRKAHKHKF